MIAVRGFSKRPLVAGAITLALANIITRIIGFAYRIFMAGAIGAEGMGLYQLIMPVYSLAWSISCSGITTTLSRLVAAEQAKGETGNMRHLLLLSLTASIIISLVLTFILFIFAEYIGVTILNDARTVSSLRILTVSIVFMAAGSCIRGYFLGLQKVMIPAVSQILEQLVRMAIILILAAGLISRGLEYAIIAATIGIVAGETISFVYVFIACKMHLKKLPRILPKMSNRQALFAIFAMSMPLTLNRISGSFLSTLENILIPQRLQLFGMTAEEAMSTFGKITGMAMPLIFFPSALLTALSISLVPSISEALAVKNTQRVENVISKSIIFTSVISFGAGLIFIVFPAEIGHIVYNQELGQILFVLGFMCPFWYINITFSGILNGLEQQVFIFRNSLLASIINILFVYFFVPIYGVNAFLFGWLTSLIIVTIFDIDRIKTHANIKPQVLRWFLKPSLAAAAAGLSINYIHNRYIMDYIGELWGFIVSLTLLMVIYIIFVVMLDCISVQDIRHILGKEKISK